MKRLFLTIMIAALTLTACTSRHDKLQTSIEQKELAMKNDIIANNDSGMELLNLYIEFANEFPNDSLSPLYLYRASDISSLFGLNDTTLTLLNRIMSDYPEFENASTCMFLKANTYDEMGLTDSAVAYYKLFAESYPSHPLAESAIKSIQYVGLSPENMLKQILASVDTSAADAE